MTRIIQYFLIESMYSSGVVPSQLKYPDTHTHHYTDSQTHTHNIIVTQYYCLAQLAGGGTPDARGIYLLFAALCSY